MGNDLKTLVPRVIGQTSEAQQRKNNTIGKQWNYELFMQDLQKNTDNEQTLVAKSIYDWAKQRVEWIWWGKGKVEGSYVPMFMHNELKYHLFAVRSKGHVELYFNTYQSRPPFDKEENRKELLAKLNNGLYIVIPEDAITKFPKVPLSILKEKQKLEEFFNIYDWFIYTVKES